MKPINKPTKTAHTPSNNGPRLSELTPLINAVYVAITALKIPGEFSLRSNQPILFSNILL